MPLQDKTIQNCIGTKARRDFLKLGMTGCGTLGMADLLRVEGLAKKSGKPSSRQKSLIVLWLWGGPSHMETFDLKPNAPVEYRGEFVPIPTTVPGMEISEHLPLIGKQAEHLSLIRSLSHHSTGHMNSTHTVLTGYKGNPIESPPYKPDHPDIWSVTGKVLGPKKRGFPTQVSMPRARYQGGAYIGSAHEPYPVRSNPNDKNFKVPNLGLNQITQPRFHDRMSLLKQIDQFKRTVDQSGMMDSIDEFNLQAVDMLVSQEVQKAFDINQENDKTRDRYGRHTVGQRCLLARRLVEAGVRTVSIDFPHVPGQKAFSWDDHASVWNIFTEMKARLPILDQVVSALIEDLSQSGLIEDTMVLVMGEMSHTPKLSNFKGQPGREHWGKSMSLLMAGGGLSMGQVIGKTNHKGDEVVDRLIKPNDFQATLYQYLGVPLDTIFEDYTGRPTLVVPDGQPIKELFS